MAYDIEYAHHNARKAVALLNGTGWKVPKSIIEALAELDRVEALTPEPADRETLRRAYADPTLDRAALDAHAARIAGHRDAFAAWATARADAANKVLKQTRAHGPDLIEHLRPAAEKALTELAWYGRNGAPDPGELLRKGKAKDAQRAATIAVVWEELAQLRKARAAGTPRGFAWGRLSWSNPHDVPGSNADGLEWFTDGIAAGGQPWWPTWDEAVRMFTDLERADEERAKAAQEKDRAIRRMAL